MLKVLIVDDHVMFREGIGVMLTTEKLADIILEAGNGKECLKILENEKPDLIIMDISMPELNGIETSKQALAKYPNLKILALSLFGDEKYYYQMVEAGVKGFVLKTAHLAELVKAIQEVTHGGSWFSNELLRNVISTFRKKEQIEHDFTKRELEVLHLVCQGYTNESIAEQIHLSGDTVRKYRNNLLAKTNSRNTASLILFAIKNKLVEI